MTDSGCAACARAQADAVLHFGAHGSLELMPGKREAGMSQ